MLRVRARLQGAELPAPPAALAPFDAVVLTPVVLSSADRAAADAIVGVPAFVHWKYAEAVPATPQIPEIAGCEDAFARMLQGDDPNVSAAQARTALDEANEDRRGGWRGRELGFAILGAQVSNDGQDFDVLVTDGTRAAAMLVHLSGTQVAVHAEAVVEHVLDRLRGAAGSLPNQGNRYENILLYHPLGLL